jgi:hypothetical protein
MDWNWREYWRLQTCLVFAEYNPTCLPGTEWNSGCASRSVL